MIRILSVVHGNTFGGPHNSNMLVAPVLREQYGVETIVLIPEEPGNAMDRMRAGGVEVVEVPVHRLRKKLDPRFHWRCLRGWAQTVTAMERLIVERSIDVVQINGISNPHGALAARRAKVPIVWQMLDTFPPPWFLSVMMPYVRRTAGSFMSTGELVASAHPGVSRMRDKLVTFHPPVDVQRFSFDPERKRAARAELGLALSDEVVGNVSNINPQKGHATFIRAAANLKQSRPHVKFVILGRRYDAHRVYIENLLELAKQLGLKLGEDLILRDPGERVADLAMAFDVFWMTSEPRSEGIPTVIEEAMSLGLPIVATEAGAIAEIVLHEKTGYLIKPHDHVDISERTQKLLEDESLRRALGEAGARFARANFPIEACAKKHLRAYEIALGRSIPPLGVA